ncbi:transposase [Nonomuraea sp. NPDC050310]|uniref:transposase n=2 Tax=Nonomuraea sp. NPDC050310 TaxID=3154935 RepID=UPI0033F45FC0
MGPAAPGCARQARCGRPARPVQGGAGLGPCAGEKGVLSDRAGLPLVVGVSSGNTHDGEALKPVVTELHMRRDPRHGRFIKPGKVHADKAYDRDDLRRWLRGRRIAVRIARRGIESSQRLGRHRWVIERTMSWLAGYRRLTIRYERYSGNYLAFLGLAAAMCCYKRLIRLTT